MAFSGHFADEHYSRYQPVDFIFQGTQEAPQVLYYRQSQSTSGTEF
jgi:hypothetical protein